MEPIRDPTLGRRGESTGFKIGRVTPSRTGSEEAIYESLELYPTSPCDSEAFVAAVTREIVGAVNRNRQTTCEAGA
jgi:hypothetical protein